MFLFQAEWVALNYVPFAEKSLEVMVDLYQKTACHKAVVNEKVLQNIILVCIILSLFGARGRGGGDPLYYSNQ